MSTVYRTNTVGHTVDLVAENIPTELKRRPQWVNWAFEERDGEPTKVPYNPHTMRRASATDLATWSGFEDVIEAQKNGRYDGIGFVFSSGDPFSGVDLDKCRNPETGEVANWAQKWIDHFDAYAEVSPTGTGVHIIVKGKSPKNGKRTANGRVVEIYSRERFFTFTGVLL